MSSTTQHVSVVIPPTAPAATPDSSMRHLQLARIARWATLAAIVVAALLLAGVVGLGLYAYSHDDRIYEGVTVAGVAVGGMSREEAGVAIQQRFDSYASVPLSLLAEGKVFPVTPTDAGARLDLDATLDAAFSYGREGSFWTRSRDWARALVRGDSVSPRIVIEAGRLDAQLDQIAAAVDRDPSDAYVQMDASGQPQLVADIAGVSLDRDAGRRVVLTAIAGLSSGTVDLNADTVPANVPAGQLAGGLPAAQLAVAAPLVLTSVEGNWTLPPEALKQLVAVDDSGQLVVDRDALGQFVAQAASDVDRPAVDTGIEVRDDGSLAAVPGSYSATVDQGATLEGAIQALLSGNHSAPVVIQRAAPAITDADAHDAISEAEALIGKGIDLTWVEGGHGRLERADLLRALVIQPQPDSDQKFSISLDPGVLAEVLFPFRDEIDIPVQDARFRLVDGEVTLVNKEKVGRATDLPASVDAITSALNNGDGSAELRVVDVDPTVRASDKKKIKTPDLLAQSATYYGNSSDPRRQNVERAVNLEAGWLIPPDGVFSYVENIGKVDQSNGFTTGFGIVADGDGFTTSPVVGGGICQVSTTIFQAAFWSGLKIEERWQHPYWLVSYGQPPYGMKGLDAMVNIEDDWALDMKFRNNTDNWIAVVVIADGENVTAQIFGTDPGWEVTASDPVITNVVPADPKTYYTDSPELPQGEEKQVESAGEGFDASITRTVTKDGQVIDEYVLESSFAASRNTILRGTG